MSEEGYVAALEPMQVLFNRLHSRSRLGEACEDCLLVVEVLKLLELYREARVEELEHKLGYYSN